MSLAERVAEEVVARLDGSLPWFVGTDEARRMTGLGRDRLRALAASGEVVTKRDGHRLLYCTRSLRAFMDSL